MSRLSFSVCVLAAFCVGCGDAPVSDVAEFTDLHPVSGKVTFQGRPLAGGTVRLHSLSAQGANGQPEVHSGIVREDGYYEVHTFRPSGRGLGVPAGEYLMSFSWLGVEEGQPDVSEDELPERLPVEYTHPQTSGVTATVEEGVSVVTDVDLK